MAKTATAPAASASGKVKDAAEAAVPNFGFSTTGKKKEDAQIITPAYKNIHVEPGFNPRKKIGDVTALADAIKSRGLIHPLTVRPYPDGTKPGHYRLVAGERRYRALGNLGWESVTVIVRDDLTNDDIAAKAVAGSENGDEARQPLSHEERGDMYKEFSTQGWSVKKIAKETGAGERDVRRCMELVDAPEDVRKAFDKGTLNFSTAIAVAALDDETRKAALKEFGSDTGEEATQSKIKAFAKEFNKGEDTKPGTAANKKKGKARAASLKAWKGHKVVDKQLAELCYIYVNADDAEKGTTRWHETRGALGMVLWQHGDVSYPVMIPVNPDETSDPKESKKELKRIAEIIEAWASKHEPDPEDAAEGDTEGATEVDPAAAAAE